MNPILTFILGIIVGGVGVWVFRKRKPLDFARGEQTRQKRENLQKVLELFISRDKLTNDDIQKLLGVSDATATRYLEELEKEGRIRQAGRTGRGVYYEKI